MRIDDGQNLTLQPDSRITEGCLKVLSAIDRANMVGDL